MKNATIQSSEVLNLNEEMVNSLIKKVEASIFDQSKALDLALPELHEAESIYLPIKSNVDSLIESIEKEKKTLEALIGFRDNKNERKNIRVYKSLSNSEVTSKKPRRQRYQFLAEAIGILATEKKFLSPDNIIRKIFEKNPSWKIIFNNGQETREKDKIRWNLIYTAHGKVTKNPKILIHNDKIGLREWFEGVNPKPEFLQSLMNSNV
jgi:hypothetical protein